MGERIFVYGTLKRGFPNHARFLGNARWLGDYKTVAPYPLVLNGRRRSPCLVDAPGHGYAVEGELFEVDDTTLAALDRLERIGAADGYHRRRIAVVARDAAIDARVEVYAYLKAPHLVHDARSACLPEYTPELGARYTPRARNPREMT